jgi:hypothetical protein
MDAAEMVSVRIEFVDVLDFGMEMIALYGEMYLKIMYLRRALFIDMSGDFITLL